MGTSVRKLSIGMALVLGATQVAAQGSAGTCSPEAFERFHRELAAAQNVFQRGDAEPLKALWSHADDVTLMGAGGGYERGWALVGARMSRIAANDSGWVHDDTVISTIIGPNMASIVQLERFVAPAGVDGRRVAGPQPDFPVLRVTWIARCQSGTWQVVHRQADPLVENQTR